jgi:hypothetical protein
VADSLNSAGERKPYTFTAEPGHTVYLDGLSSSANFRAMLTDETGAEVMPEWWLDRDAGVVTLERGGTYTITVFGVQETTGAFSFKLWDVPAPLTFEFAIGDVVSEGSLGTGSGNIESPGAQDIYTFTAAARQGIMFDGQGGSPSIRATMTDEAGTVIFQGEWLDRAAAIRTLERSGTYTITVSSVDGMTGAYSFQVWDVPSPQEFELQIGDTVSDGEPGAGAGSIETPGVRDIYTFTAQPGQVIFFDAITGGPYIRATMTDEDGAPIFENEWTDRAAVQHTLERGGTYTITVSGVDDTVGAYSFQLWQVAPPQEFATAIGDVVSDGVPAVGAGNLESPGAQDIYTFSAQAGAVIAFEPQGGNYYMRARLVDEAGSVIFEDVPMDRAAGEYMLARGGTYTLTITNVLDAYGTYAFQVIRR